MAADAERTKRLELDLHAVCFFFFSLPLSDKPEQWKRFFDWN